MCLYLQTKRRSGRSFKAKRRREQDENLILVNDISQHVFKIISRRG